MEAGCQPKCTCDIFINSMSMTFKKISSLLGLARRCLACRAQRGSPGRFVTMRAWPVARSIFDAPYVREANEGTTSWIRRFAETYFHGRNVRHDKLGLAQGPRPGTGFVVKTALEGNDQGETIEGKRSKSNLERCRAARQL